MEKLEFIVAYCSRFCRVELVRDQTTLNGRESSFIDDYRMALARRRKKWGDVAAYNNQFWGAVMAENAREAIDILLNKMEGDKKHGY